MAHTEQHHSMATDKKPKANASQKQVPQLSIDTATSPQPQDTLPRSLTADNPNDPSRADQGMSRLDILAAAAESKRYPQFRTFEDNTLANDTKNQAATDEDQLTPNTTTNEEVHLPSMSTITSSVLGSGSPSSPIYISSSPSSTPARIAGPTPTPTSAPPASTSILPPTWKPTRNNDVSLTTALDNPITYKISLPPPRSSAHLTCGNGCGRKYAVMPTGFGGLVLARGEREVHREELFWRAGFVGCEETLEMAREWRGRQEREKSGEEVVREVEHWKRRHEER